MPIRPEMRDKYPANWRQISARIRERAGQRCECNGECGLSHYNDDTPLGRCDAGPNGQYILRSKHDPARWWPMPRPLAPGQRPVKVVLTVAHLNHDPTDNRDENLLALCQLCHLNLDKHEHAKNARQTRHARKAHRELF